LSGIGLLIIIFIAIVFIVFTCSKLKWHPFIALISSAIFIGLTSGIKLNDIPKLMAEGFGNMMAHIGIVVILGTLIGTILEKTGATEVISNAILKFLGQDKPVLAITIIGLVVGIPIFCDSGYIILSGLTKPLAKVSRKPYTSIVAGLSGGLYITHTLLPPHPGSIAGAANLGLASHLGTVILIGLTISIPISIIAWLWADKGVYALHVNEDIVENKISLANRPLVNCLLPIVVPVFLIALGSINSIFSSNSMYLNYLNFIGHPIIALLIGLLLSLLILQKEETIMLTDWVKEGVSHAGPILILVGAGGIFGNILKNTSLSTWVVDIIGQENEMSVLLFFLIAFLLGVLLKTAQGSTTSAIIVVSSILAPMCEGIGIDTSVELTFLLCSIASGSMMISHANDAYFWVISQFSGLSMIETYKTFSTTSIVLSISTFLVTIGVYLLTNLIY
jgi:GntP family gluconate:H+ symporter